MQTGTRRARRIPNRQDLALVAGFQRRINRSSLLREGSDCFNHSLLLSFFRQGAPVHPTGLLAAPRPPPVQPQIDARLNPESWYLKAREGIEVSEATVARVIRKAGLPRLRCRGPRGPGRPERAAAADRRQLDLARIDLDGLLDPARDPG
ncbi:MAG: hypothetical protein OXI01_13950, partial [Albidovulum sp.]|nr:hypothetical protein [Albidovulum sp.]